MLVMHERWLSRRAITLHVAVVLWVPMCVLAGWWQVTRAFDGNGLSYLYSVEWPIFAIVGLVAWWALVHTDPETVGARAQRRLAARIRSTGPGGSDGIDGTDGRNDGIDRTDGPDGPGQASAMDRYQATSSTPNRDRAVEDDELAAYNDHLAELAAGNRPKTWRRT
jgi:hypothetical protein